MIVCPRQSFSFECVLRAMGVVSGFWDGVLETCCGTVVSWFTMEAVLVGVFVHHYVFSDSRRLCCIF